MRFRKVMIILSALILIYSIYKIASYYFDDIKRDQVLNEARETFYSSSPQSMNFTNVDETSNVIIDNEGKKDSEEDNTLVVQERFHNLLAINEDVVGWVKIDDTVIDYPVVQGVDNEEYLNLDLYKEKNANGSIFLDFRNDIKGTQKHFILYGHNMKNKSMFTPILNYESAYFFNEHPTITFDTLYGSFTWEIFSVHFTDIHHNYIKTDFKDDNEFETFIKDLQNRSLHNTNININANDIILTLSTCTNIDEASRFAVHAKLVAKTEDEKW